MGTNLCRGEVHTHTHEHTLWNSVNLPFLIRSFPTLNDLTVSFLYFNVMFVSNKDYSYLAATYIQSNLQQAHLKINSLTIRNKTEWEENSNHPAVGLD